MKRLVRRQVVIAFDQAQKEVDDLRERTKEGLREAKKRGSRVGNSKGDTLVTKRSIETKETIRKYSKDFNGNLRDTEVMKLCGVSRSSCYRHKKEPAEK